MSRSCVINANTFDAGLQLASDLSMRLNTASQPHYAKNVLII